MNPIPNTLRTQLGAMNEDSGGVIWIASYPKSGNTWLRFLACNLIFGPRESASELNHLAPDLHELKVPLPVPSTLVMMKTHLAFSPLHPLASATRAAIYVVRDPADVLLSNFHYSHIEALPKAKADPSDASEEEASFRAYVDAFIANGGDPRWFGFGMGNWEQNVASWIGRPHPFPVLSLRFEDMLKNPEKGAASICALLGLNRSREEIAQAVAGATFEKMRQIEEADIREEREGIFFSPQIRDPLAAGWRFMRSGRSGEGHQRLSAEQRERLAAVTGPLARKFGYGPFPVPA